MTTLDPDPEQVEALQRRHGKGEHFFRACHICGYVAFMSSAPNQPDKVMIQYDLSETRSCPSCLHMAQRYPEIADWAMGVVQTQIRINEQLKKKLMFFGGSKS